MTKGIDVKALREAAEKATPGPWCDGEGRRIDLGDGWDPEYSGTVWEGENPIIGNALAHCAHVFVNGRNVHGPRNAAFIAVADPTTILALLDDRATADTLIEALSGALKKIHGLGPVGWEGAPDAPYATGVADGRRHAAYLAATALALHAEWVKERADAGT